MDRYRCRSQTDEVIHPDVDERELLIGSDAMQGDTTIVLQQLIFAVALTNKDTTHFRMLEFIESLNEIGLEHSENRDLEAVSDTELEQISQCVGPLT